LTKATPTDERGEAPKTGGEMMESMEAAASPTHKNPDEGGATAVEYGLMLSLIAVAIMGTVQAMSGQLNAMYTMITGLL